MEQQAPNLRRHRSLSSPTTTAKRRNDEPSLTTNSRERAALSCPRQDRPLSSVNDKQPSRPRLTHVTASHSHNTTDCKEEKNTYAQSPEISTSTSFIARSLKTTRTSAGSRTWESRSRPKRPRPLRPRARSPSWESLSRRRSSSRSPSQANRSSPQQSSVLQTKDSPEEPLERMLRDSSVEQMRRRARSKSPYPRRAPPPLRGPTPLQPFQAVQSSQLSDNYFGRAPSPTRATVVKPKPIPSHVNGGGPGSPEAKSKTRVRQMIRSLSPRNLRRNRSRPSTFGISTKATSSSLANPQCSGAVKEEDEGTSCLNRAQTPMSHALKTSRSETNLARKKSQERKRSTSFHRMRSDPTYNYDDTSPYQTSSAIGSMEEMIMKESNLSTISRASFVCDGRQFLAPSGEESGTMNSVVTSGKNEDDSSSETASGSDSEDGEVSRSIESDQSEMDDSGDDSVSHSRAESPSRLRKPRPSMGMSPRNTKSRRSKPSVNRSTNSVLLSLEKVPGSDRPCTQQGAVVRPTEHNEKSRGMREPTYSLETRKSWKKGVLNRVSRGLRSPRRTTHERRGEEDNAKLFGELREKSLRWENLSTGGIVRRVTDSVEGEEAQLGQEEVRSQTKKKPITRWPLRKNSETKTSVDVIHYIAEARPAKLQSQPPIDTVPEPRRSRLQSSGSQSNRVQHGGTHIGAALSPMPEVNRNSTSTQNQLCYIRLTPQYLTGVVTERLRWKSSKGTENILVHGLVAHVLESGAIESPASLALSQPITPKVDSGKMSSYCLVWSNMNAADSTRGRVYMSVPFDEEGIPGDSTRAALDQEIVIAIKRGQEMIQLGYAHIPIFNRNVSGLDVEIEIVPFENTKKKGIFSKRKNAFENDDKVYGLDNVAILRATLDIKRGRRRTSHRIRENAATDKSAAVNTVEVESEAFLDNSAATRCLDSDEGSRSSKETPPQIARVPSTLPGTNHRNSSPTSGVLFDSIHTRPSPTAPSPWPDLGMTQIFADIMAWKSESFTNTHSLISANKSREESILAESTHTNDDSLLTNQISSRSDTASVNAKKNESSDIMPLSNKIEPHAKLRRDDSRDWYPSEGEGGALPDTYKTPRISNRVDSIVTPLKKVDKKDKRVDKMDRSTGLRPKTADSSARFPTGFEGSEEETPSMKIGLTVLKGNAEIMGAASNLDMNMDLARSGSSWKEDETKSIDSLQHQAEAPPRRHRSFSIPARLPSGSRSKTKSPTRRNYYLNDQISVDSGFGDIVALEHFIGMCSGVQGVQYSTKRHPGPPRLNKGEIENEKEAQNRNTRDFESFAEAQHTTTDQATLQDLVAELSSSANELVLRSSKSVTQADTLSQEETKKSKKRDIQEVPTGCSALENLSFTKLKDHSGSGDSVASTQDSVTQLSSADERSLHNSLSSVKGDFNVSTPRGRQLCTNELLDQHEESDTLSLNSKENISLLPGLASNLTTSINEEGILSAREMPSESSPDKRSMPTQQEDMRIGIGGNVRHRAPKTKPRPEIDLGNRKMVASPRTHSAKLPDFVTETSAPPETRDSPDTFNKVTEEAPVSSYQGDTKEAGTWGVEPDRELPIPDMKDGNLQQNQENAKDLGSYGSMERHSRKLEIIRGTSRYPDFGGRDRPSIDNILASFDSSTASRMETDCLGDAFESVFAAVFGADEKRALGGGHSKDRMEFQREDDAFAERSSHLRLASGQPVEDSAAISRTLPEDHWRHGPESPTKRIKTNLDSVTLTRQDSESSNLYLMQPPSLRRISRQGDRLDGQDSSGSDEKILPYEEGFEMILHKQVPEVASHKESKTTDTRVSSNFARNGETDRTTAARTPLGSSHLHLGRLHNKTRLISYAADHQSNSVVETEKAKTPIARNTCETVPRRLRRQEQEQLWAVEERPESLNSISFSFSESDIDSKPPRSENYDHKRQNVSGKSARSSSNKNSDIFPDVTEGLIGPSAREKRDLGFTRRRRQRKCTSQNRSQHENLVAADVSDRSSKRGKDFENATVKLFQISKKLGLTPEALLSQLESGEDIGIPSTHE